MKIEMNLTSEKFLSACGKGDVDAVRLMLKNPQVEPFVYPTEFHFLPIALASKNGHVEVVRLLLSDPRCNPTDQNNWAIRLASIYDKLEIVCLLLTDPRVNPKGEEGIYIQFINNEYIEIAIIDGVLCQVRNGDTSSIGDETIREKFAKWQYRIGGEKWAQACNSLK